MPRDISNRRNVNRQKIPAMLSASLQARTPDGVSRKLPIVDVSPTDVCFASPSSAPLIEIGCVLTDVWVQVADFGIECNLTVQRTWRQFDGSYHCGARLYPKTEDDQNELVSLVAALQAANLKRQSV